MTEKPTKLSNSRARAKFNGKSDLIDPLARVDDDIIIDDDWRFWIRPLSSAVGDVILVVGVDVELDCRAGQAAGFAVARARRAAERACRH